MRITIKQIMIMIFAIVFLAFIGNAIYNAKIGLTKFTSIEYDGVITDIKHHNGDRGIPDIKINNQWMNLDYYGYKVRNYIKTGDSIVKKSGTEAIVVYRKNLSNEWEVRIFK